MNNSTTPKDAQVFSIIGEPASKANSRRAVVIGGKPRFIKSSKALGYSSMFKQQLIGPGENWEEDVAVEITIYYASRRPDLDESLILDLLQGYAYKNDRQVKEKHIFWGLDKENPRAEIKIWKI
jgi:Holliday junction resolvase RusA-like endonuclease|tara:strand:- start:1749 stop:2120 length:372 start_codon:yes stop_codon:yes gene_type:complete